MNRSSMAADRRDVVILIFALAGMLFSLGASFALFVLVIVARMRGNTEDAFLAAWAAFAFAFIGLLGAPSLYWSGGALLGRSPAPANRPPRLWLLLTAIFPLGILGSYAAFELQLIPSLISFPSFLLATSTPVLLSVLLVRFGGPRASPLRSWVQFLSGLWVVPPVALVFEALLLIPLLLVIGGGLALTPEGQVLIEQLGRSLPEMSLEQPPEFAIELIFQPWILTPVLVYISVLVPLVEEGLKSIAVWPLLRRNLTGAEAFMGGALAGAGYALFEALFLTQPGELWLAAIVGRTGASFLHPFTAGIVSWGLVEGVQRRRWRRFVLAYLFATGFHGLWNASAVAMGLSILGSEGPASRLSAPVTQTIQVIAPMLLFSMTAIAVTGLALLGRQLRRGRQTDTYG